MSRPPRASRRQESRGGGAVAVGIIALTTFGFCLFSSVAALLVARLLFASAGPQPLAGDQKLVVVPPAIAAAPAIPPNGPAPGFPPGMGPPLAGPGPFGPGFAGGPGGPLPPGIPGVPPVPPVPGLPGFGPIPQVPQPRAEPVVIRARLGPDGRFTHDNELTASDARDFAFPKSPYKCYEIDFEAGATYVIDHVSNQFDAYLRLLDDARNELARDDDSGGNLNARIRFTAPRTALYFIHASQLGPQPGRYTVSIRRDGGVPAAPPKLDPLKLTGAAGSGTKLTTTERALPGGGRVSFITFAGKATLVGDVLWERDGNAFFLLDADGVLRRIRTDGWVEERRLDLRCRVGNLARSAAGLLVALPEQQEVWVIDPATLKPGKRHTAPGVRRVVSAPGLHAAVAVSDGGGPINRDVLLLIDLTKQDAIRTFNLPTLHLAMSGDGKYVFAQGGIEQMLRFRLDGDKIIKDGETPRIAQNGQGIFVSPDGKYVCLPSGGGNYGGLPNHPQVPTYSTYIYPTGDLTRPAFAIHAGAYPGVVGFDPAGGNVFAQNHDKQLIVFSMAGVKQKEYRIAPGPGPAEEPHEFAAHPRGNRLLIRFDRRLAFVELPAAKKD